MFKKYELILFLGLLFLPGLIISSDADRLLPIGSTVDRFFKQSLSIWKDSDGYKAMVYHPSTLDTRNSSMPFTIVGLRFDGTCFVDSIDYTKALCPVSVPFNVAVKIELMSEINKIKATE